MIGASSSSPIWATDTNQNSESWEALLVEVYDAELVAQEGEASTLHLVPSNFELKAGFRESNAIHLPPATKPASTRISVIAWKVIHCMAGVGAGWLCTTYIRTYNALSL